MRRNKVDSKVEKQLITAMIVSKEFLGQAISAIDVKLIGAEHLQIVAKWCIKYFEKYGKAPGKYIESMYYKWSEKGNAKEEIVEAVHDLLEQFSDDYDEGILNVPYLLDSLGEYLTFQKLEKTKEDLEDALLDGNKEAAENAILNYSTVNVGMGAGTDPVNDDDVWARAYAESQKPLFQFKSKDANRFFSNAFSRDGLIAILAPEKRGKTFWCVEFMMRALMNRCTVALFEVGDMSESQIYRRLGCRVSKRPQFQHQCGNIEVPRRIFRNDAGEIDIETATVNCSKMAAEKSSKEAMKKFVRSCGLPPKLQNIKISCHPNMSINVAGISGILDMWELEKDFIPDIVIIDYPDILDYEPGTGNMAERDKINTRWKALRRLSQERHNLVIVPTQADTDSYDAEFMNMKNFTEDKRKLSHVTGMLGLCQKEEEKEKGLMRLNWVVLREDEFVSSRCLHVAQCLPLARAFCCAVL